MQIQDNLVLCISNDGEKQRNLSPNVVFNPEHMSSIGWRINDPRFDSQGNPKNEEAFNLIPEKLQKNFRKLYDENARETSEETPAEESLEETETGDEAQDESNDGEESQQINHSFGISKDYNAKNAVATMAELDKEDIAAFIEGDERKTVIDAANKILG